MATELKLQELLNTKYNRYFSEELKRKRYTQCAIFKVKTYN